MVVYDEDSLKEALKKEEPRIEIEGKYAEEVIIKSGHFLHGKLPEKFGAGCIIAGAGGAGGAGGVASVGLNTVWCGTLHKYEVESYDKEKLIINLI